MAMQFNPHTAFLRGMDLGSPTTSQGGINNLLNMQQQSIGDLIGAVGNIGKTSRTNTVNDLIARGGLEGLNEAQAQARLQQEAGGTLTPEGQASVDKLLQVIGKEDQRKFTTSERLSGQDFTNQQQQNLFGHQTDERLGRQTFDNSQRELGEKFQGTQKEADRALEKLLKEKQIASSEKMSSMQINATLRGQYKQEAGADGYYYNIYPDGSSVRTNVKVATTESGSGYSGARKGDVLEMTGATKDLYESLSPKGKDAFKQIYGTGNLKAEYLLDDKGRIDEKKGFKILLDGKPTTIKDIKTMVERKK